MDKINEKKICIIGAGRVGTTFAAAILNSNIPGIKLVAVSSRSSESLEKAENFLGAKAAEIAFLKNNTECAKTADCIFISTPDDIIEKVASEIAGKDPKTVKDKLFIHFSGSKPLKVFDTILEAGGYGASMHPIKSFASVKDSLNTLKGTIYGVTYPEKQNDKINNFINFFIASMGGKLIEVADNKKPMYHAAACVISNYLVSLVNYAVKIHESIGIKPEDSIASLSGLLEGTVKNIKTLGPDKALTGPIARGDTGTIKEHMDNFRVFMEPGDELVYKVMGIQTAKIAFGNGWIDKKTLQEFIKIFS